MSSLKLVGDPEYAPIKENIPQPEYVLLYLFHSLPLSLFPLLSLLKLY